MIEQLLHLDDKEQTILLKIVRYIGDKETCHHSQSRIAKDTKIALRTVVRKLANLRAYGYLIVTEQKNERGGTTTCLYSVDWHKIEAGIKNPPKKIKTTPTPKSRGLGVGVPPTPNADLADPPTPNLQDPLRHGGVLKQKEEKQKEENKQGDLILAEGGEEAASPPAATPTGPMILSQPKTSFDQFFQSDDVKEAETAILAIYREALPRYPIFSLGHQRRQTLSRIVSEYGKDDVVLGWRYLCINPSDEISFIRDKNASSLFDVYCNHHQKYIDYAKEFEAEKQKQAEAHKESLQRQEQRRAAREAFLAAPPVDPTPLLQAAQRIRDNLAAEHAVVVAEKRKARDEAAKAWEEMTGRSATLKVPHPPGTGSGKEELEKLKRLLATKTPDPTHA